MQIGRRHLVDRRRFNDRLPTEHSPVQQKRRSIIWKFGFLVAADTHAQFDRSDTTPLSQGGPWHCN